MRLVEEADKRDPGPFHPGRSYYFVLSASFAGPSAPLSLFSLMLPHDQCPIPQREPLTAIAASSRPQMKSPGRGDRGFRDGRGWGVGVLPSNQKSEPLHVDGGPAVRASSFSRRDRRILSTSRRRDRPPRNVPFSQPLFQATYDLAGTPQCEGNCVPKDFSLRHSLNRT